MMQAMRWIALLLPLLALACGDPPDDETERTSMRGLRIDVQASQLEVIDAGPRVADGVDAVELAIEIIDHSGRPATDIEVRLATLGEGVLVDPPSRTDGQGRTRAWVRSTEIGEKIVRATAITSEGTFPLEGSVRLQFVVGAPHQLFVRLPEGEIYAGAPFPGPVEVEVHDAGGRLVDAEPEIRLSVASSGLDLGRAVAVDGIATFEDLWLNAASSGERLIATAEGLRTGTSADFAVHPGRAHHLAILDAPESLVAGDSGLLTVEVRDVHGNRVTNVDARVELRPVAQPIGGVWSGGRPVTTDAGRAVSELVVQTAGSWRFAAHAVGLTPSAPIEVKVFVGKPSVERSRIVGILPRPVVSDELAAPVRIEVRDAADNPVPGVELDIVSLNPPAALTRRSTDASGVVQFGVTWVRAGELRLEARGPDGFVLEGSLDFQPGPPDAARTVVDSPAAVPADGVSVAQLVMRVVDEYYNDRTGLPVRVVPRDPRVIPVGSSWAITDELGMVSFGFRSTVPYYQTVDVVFGEGAEAVEDFRLVDFDPLPALFIEVLRGNHGLSTPGQQFALEFRAIDALGNPAFETPDGPSGMWRQPDGSWRISSWGAEAGHHQITITAGLTSATFDLFTIDPAPDRGCTFSSSHVRTFDGLVRPLQPGIRRAWGRGAPASPPTQEAQVRVGDAGSADGIALRFGATVLLFSSAPALALSVDGIETPLPAPGESLDLGPAGQLTRDTPEILRLVRPDETYRIHHDGVAAFSGFASTIEQGASVLPGQCGDGDGDSNNDVALVNADLPAGASLFP